MKIVVTSLCIFLTLSSAQAFAHKGQHSEVVSKSVATQMAMRDLWVDHVFWVRGVVSATAAKDKKAQAEAEKQVVDNAKRIAATIEPFYGKPASDKLFELLAGHYAAIKDYMNATLPSPNATKQKAATEKVTANAVQIADFLSGANPNLPKGTLMALLSAHGGHHVTQINQFQNRDYAGEARTWTDMKGHMYVVADALVAGIAKQFPDKF